MSAFVFSAQIKEVLDIDEEVHSLAQDLHKKKSLLVMGRGYNYATCLEGALVYTQKIFIYKLQLFCLLYGIVVCKMCYYTSCNSVTFRTCMLKCFNLEGTGVLNTWKAI